MSGKQESCLFCKIVDKQIPAKIIEEDDYSIAFEDINPQAPDHLLVIPKAHFENVSSIEDPLLLGNVMHFAAKLAREKCGESKGFRLVINTGTDGGQTVFHLHVHVLGGRALSWPPG